MEREKANERVNRKRKREEEKVKGAGERVNRKRKTARGRQ